MNYFYKKAWDNSLIEKDDGSISRLDQNRKYGFNNCRELHHRVLQTSV
jgi:hypothetical protein